MHLFSYIDPGTGSLFIQSVIGIGLAVSVVFRNVIGGFFGTVKTLITRRSAKNED